MKLVFLGATNTVTGSKYLLENDGHRILVDCGLFQGLKELRLRNWQQFNVDPATIDAIVLTHAHMDHSGYIPRLVKSGFKGPIYCTASTFDLCKILLPDSGHLQERDAERANLYEYSRHKPALPLYTEEEARESLKYFKPLPFDHSRELAGGLNFTFHRAGHILGAACIRMVQDDGTTIVFSGDIGRFHDPLMKPPAKIQKADYLIVESTYGDRLHDTQDPMDDLGYIINKTAERGGTVVIPAFAVGRAQTLMYYIHMLKEQHRIRSDIPVFLDSPMAIDASELLGKHINDHRLSAKLCREVCNVAEYTHTVDQSKAIFDNSNGMPKIIISASGMATGGRVLHHLKNYLGDSRNTILLAGFQAAGTRGDRLARGESEIKIHGRMWPVRAEIVKLDNMSAHADYKEILSWISNFTSPLRKVFITHGEPASAHSLKRKIEQQFGWESIVPEYQHEEQL